MDKNELKIVFMGTPEFAVESLRRLVENGYRVVAVVTQPDKPVGRHGSVLRAPAVKEYAVAQGIPVLQPVKMKDPAFLEELAGYGADVQVVVAFRMLPEVVWGMPRLGTFNVHAALLPQYRGAAPINWAIINGETRTGVTTFFLDHQIDTGRVIMQRGFDIPDEADVEYVYDGLMRLGAELCQDTIDALIESDGQLESVPQDQLVEGRAEGAALHQAPKIFKETCKVDWRQGAKAVYDFVRGLSPVPAAWTTLVPVAGDGQPLILKLYRTAKTGRKTDAGPGTIKVDRGGLFVSAADEWLEIKDLQLSGKKRMAARDFLNGMRQVADFRCE